MTHAKHVISARFNIRLRNALKIKGSVPKCNMVIVTVNQSGGTRRWPKSLSEERRVGHNLNKKKEDARTIYRRGSGPSLMKKQQQQKHKETSEDHGAKMGRPTT